MYINGKEFTQEINHPLYIPYPNKVGGMCVGMDLLEWFKKIMKNYNSYLEVGSFDGIMISVLAETYPEKTFSSIDCFSGGYATGGGHREYFIENNKRCKNVSLYEGMSTVFLPSFQENSFDVIFLDGDHSYDVVIKDLFNAYRTLKSGGILAIHDIDHVEVNNAIQEFRTHYNLQVNVEPFLAWVRKG